MTTKELFPTVENKLLEAEQLVTENPEIPGLQSYEYLRSDIAAQSDAFLVGEDITLSYEGLATENYIKTADQATTILRMLYRGDESEKTEALYDSIEYRLAEMSMLSAANIMNNGKTEAERSGARESFKQMNEALYGVPEQGTFTALAKREIAPLLAVKSEDASTQTLQAELKDLLGPLDADESELFTPAPELVQHLQGMVTERFKDLVSHVDDEKTYLPQDMVDAMTTALEAMGATELGWTAEVTTDSASMATSAHRRLIEVGENRDEIVGSDLKELIIHEIGVHALRSINAEKTGWLSAAYGQDGYLAFEESLATALQASYAGEVQPSGVNYYLIAGLAYGMDGEAPRDMRQVHEIFWRFNALSKSKGEPITEDKVLEAKQAALGQCMRMFRGTTTKDPGVIYLKDLAYFDGQEKAWSVLEQVQTPEDLEFLLMGKLDLTREDHVKIAKDIQATLAAA